jgi:thiol-disulfide isomerase/thioredoxin
LEFCDEEFRSLDYSRGSIGGIAVVASGARDEGRMPDLGGAVTWLNSAPLNSNAPRGRVVLVNFWTYSCINSVRELPYMKAWAAKYKGAGLVLIGVHALEFGFERDPADVKAAVSDLNITYPVPIDSIHSISNNFRNEYWTADCFIDGKRRIRYHHVDEVLRENGATGLDESIVHSTAEGPKAPPSNDVQSPETYVGDARAENFASPERTARDSRKTYSPPVKPALNHRGPGGSGNIRAKLATLESASGRLYSGSAAATSIWFWARLRMGCRSAST